MKKHVTKFLLSAVLIVSTTTLWAQTLIAGWDFQTTTNGGTAAAASPSAPSSYTANFGSGTLYLNGSNGSSTWVTASSGNEVTAFAGTANNAGTGFATTTTTPACLAVVCASTTTSNGKSMVFKFSMTNFTNLVVSYSTQKSGTTAFGTHTWEYSTNGTTWTALQTVSTIPTSFATTTLTATSVLDNATNAYLRVTVSGATATGGNNRFDNIQINATCTPPSFTTTKSDVSCFGGTNGSITVSAPSGGASPYFFSKDNGTTYSSPGQTTAFTFSGLSAASYNIKVKSNTGCVSNASPVTISQPASAPSFSTSKTDETISGANDGSITVTPSGGTAGYYFSNDNGGTYTGVAQSTPYTFTGLTPGTYQVVVKDANGCITSASSVTINAGAGITAIAVAPANTSIAAVYNQNTTNNVLLGFSITPTSSTNFTGLTVTTSGTATSAAPDFTNFRFVRDANTNGVFDGGDVVIATVANLSSTLTFSSFTEAITSAKNYLIIGDVPCAAGTGKTLSTAVGTITTAATVTGTATGSQQTGSYTIPAAPATPTAAANPACTSTTLNIYAPVSGTTNFWQGTTNNGQLTSNGNTSSTYAVSATGTYYVQARDNTTLCWSTTSSSLAVTVNTAIAFTTSPPATRTITAPSSTTFTVVATGSVAGYQWEYNDGSGWQNATGAPYSGGTTATLTISPSSTTISGYQYRCTVSGTAPCAAVSSSVCTLTVSPAPCGNESFSNIVTGSSTYNATPTTFTGDNGLVWTYQGARTDQTLTGSALCFGTNSVTTRTITSATYSGGIGVLTFNYVRGFTGTGLRSLQVYVNGTQIGTDVTVSPTSNTVVQYSATINQGGSVQVQIVCNGASQVIVDDISWTCYVPCAVVQSTTPGTRCGAGSVTLGATGGSVGTVLDWYDAPTGGTLLSTGTSTTFNTPSISTNTTYYVQATYLGCPNLSRTAVLATVNNGPSSLTASSSSPSCEGSTLNLTVNGTGFSTYQWSDASAATSGQIYQQNFNSLPSTGTSVTWVDNSTLPGWYANSGNLLSNGLVVSDGSSTAGNLYSFGVTSSTDRALGSQASAATNALTYGVKLTNTTGGSIDKVFVQYTGKQWRDGGAGAVPNTLGFSYSTNATSLGSGTYIDSASLSYTSTVNSNTGTGATVNGSLAANQTVKSGTITLASPVADGGTIWLKWTDINETGSDMGISLDDLTVILYSSSSTLLTAPTGSVSTPTFGAGTLTAATYAVPNNSRSGTFTVKASNLLGCSSSTTTSVVVNPRPTANLIGAAATCIGAVETYTIAFTGTAPWSFTVDTGGGTLTSTTSTSPYTFTIKPSANRLIKITSLTDANCTAQYADRDSINLTATSNCTLTWNGSISSSWHTPGNWTPILEPNSCSVDVIIPSSASVKPVISAKNIQVGNLSVQNGQVITLNSSKTLSVCKDFSGANGVGVGQYSTPLFYIQGTGKLIMNGSSAQSMYGWGQIDELVANNAAGVQLANGAYSKISIYRGLTLQSGTFTAAANTSLTLLSNSPDSVAWLNDFGSNAGSYSGKISVQRKAPSPGYNAQQNMSSPVSGAPFNSISGPYTWYNGGQLIPSSNCSEDSLSYTSPYSNGFSWNEANVSTCFTTGWTAVGQGNFNVGQGYSVYLNSGSLNTLTGTPNTGDISVSGLTNSGWSDITPEGHTWNSGWSLVGNPYASSVDVTSSRSGFDAQVHEYQPSGPYKGTYVSLTISLGQVKLPAFQGVWVHKTAVGGTADWLWKRSERNTNVGPNYHFYKNGVDSKLHINIAGNGYQDQTLIVFNDNATNSFDADFDANKFHSDKGQPTLYTHNSTDNQWMGVNVMGSLTPNTTVPMGVEPGADGQFTLTFDGVETFDANTTIILEDKKLHTMTPIHAGDSYTFTAVKTDNWERFVLHFNTQQSTSINGLKAEAINVYSVANKLLVDFTKSDVVNASIEVYNIIGQQVVSDKYTGSGVYQHEMTEMSSGYAIVRVKLANGELLTKKVYFCTNQ